MGILKDRRQRATPIRSRIDKELIEVRANLKLLASDETEKTASLKEKENSLIRPAEIKAIFEELCRRLDSIKPAGEPQWTNPNAQPRNPRYPGRPQKSGPR